jgi:hypothetical protein
MKASPIINNFSAGEFGPLARARTDLDRYKSSVEVMENFLPLSVGAVVKRTATKYVSEAISNTSDVKLIPFIFSNDQAYVLEFCEDIVRFYTDGGQIVAGGGSPIEITNPFYGLDITKINYCQSNDILYLFHEEALPRKIIRYSDTEWVVEDFSGYGSSGSFNYGPFYNSKSYYDDRKTLRSLTPAATSGTNVLLTPSIVSLTYGSSPSPDVIVATAASDIKAKAGEILRLRGTLGLGIGYWKVKIVSYDSSTLELTIKSMDGSTLTTSSLKLITVPYFNHVNIFDVSGNKWIKCVVTDHAPNTGSPSFLPYTDGQVKIRIDGTFSGTGAFNLFEVPFWGLDVEGSQYPASGCFHEDRLFTFGPNQRIDGSRVGDYENFTTHEEDGTVIDSNAVSFNLNSTESNFCIWGVSDEKGLLVGTSANEWLLKSASSQTGITPTSISAKKATSFGSKKVQPLQVGKAAIFTQLSGKKIREFNYFYDVDGFRCQDMNQLAHSIVNGKVKQLALQKQPDQIVWAVTEDGLLNAMTYERDIEGVRVAWHRHPIAGSDVLVRSVCSIPAQGSSYDEVWIVVQRTINGSTKQYIEYMGKIFDEEDAQENGFFVDCGLTYSGASATVISGLSHLEGEEVSVCGDGVNLGLYTVSSGSITLREACTKAHIGLKYSAKIKLNRFDAGSQDGTSLGKTRRSNRLGVCVNRTLGLKYGQDFENMMPFEFQDADENLDEGPSLYTGIMTTEIETEYSLDNNICLMSDEPTNCAILAVMPQMTTQDR